MTLDGTIIREAMQEKGLAVQVDVYARSISVLRWDNVYGSCCSIDRVLRQTYFDYIIDTPLIDTPIATCPAIGPFPFYTWLSIFMFIISKPLIRRSK